MLLFDVDDVLLRYVVGLWGVLVFEDVLKEVRDGKLYDGGYGDLNDCILVVVIEYMGVLCMIRVM